jgi:hypothetical protein
VADAGRLDLDKDFTRLRAIQIKLDDFKRPFGFERDSGACLHLFHLPQELGFFRVPSPERRQLLFCAQ